MCPWMALGNLSFGGNKINQKPKTTLERYEFPLSQVAISRRARPRENNWFPCLLITTKALSNFSLPKPKEL